PPRPPLFPYTTLFRSPRATAPWDFWHLWQYCGDGKCDLPRAAYPTSIANIRKAERNIFRGNRSALEDFWQNRAWQLGGDKRRREDRKSTRLNSSHDQI